MQVGLQACASVCTLEAERVDSKIILLKNVNKMKETFCIIFILN